MSLLILSISALGFVLGVSLASFLSLSFPVLFWFVLLALASFLFWEKHKTRPGSMTWYLLVVLLIGVTLGGWRMEVAKENFTSSPLQSSFNTEVVLEGVVKREPDQRQNNTQLYLQVNNDMVLLFTERNVPVFYGDVLRVQGKLEEPESFVTDLGREFDYQNYLRAEGVVAVIRYGEIEVIGQGEGNYIIGKLLTAKGAFMETIRSLLPSPSDGLGLGLLLGVKGALDKEIEDSFRESGIIHIVVLSGYNIMLVVAFIMYFLGRLRPTPRLVFGLLGITAFALMVGLSATVLRASVMAAVLLFVDYSKRQYDALRALLLAGVVMISVNPYLLIYSIGFQLSFVATWGLIVFSDRFEKYLKFVPEWGGVRKLLAVTLATQLAVTPLLLFHIGQISLVAVFTNLLVLPLVPLAMLATFLLGVAGILYLPLAKWLLPLTYFILTYIILAADYLSKVPMATTTVNTFSPGWLVLMYGLIFWWWQSGEVTVEAAVSLDDWEIVEESKITKTDTSESDASASTLSLFR